MPGIFDFDFNAQHFTHDALTKLTPLSDNVARHLSKVYVQLGAMMLAAATGVAFHLYGGMGGLLTALAGFGVLIYTMSIPRHETQKRSQLFLLFALLQGMSIGPLCQHVIEVDPMIVFTALMGTVTLFACFSGAAMLARRREYLFLGGALSSCMSMMAIFSLINMFWRSSAYANIYLYGGLFIFAGYIIFDTQMIIERAHAGSADYVQDAFNLFANLIAIFVRLMIILMRNAEKKNRKERR